MNRKLKKIPAFSSEDEEREFWSHANSTEYIDRSKAKERSLSRLKPTARTIDSSAERRPPDSR
ncbi:MAG TPA: CopG family antitoxin [Thermoanaerobaculia bacterium]|nr:CopG family antitoxin [Thermoanaerobaculia bacterium]